MAKILSELETRHNILAHAKAIGAEKDVLIFFNKYDKLLKECKNEQEREQIVIMATSELYTAIGAREGLSVNYKQIIPPESGNSKNKIIT